MKTIEKLFEDSTVDTRKVLNRSNKVIPQTVLDEIETVGVTCERLESLNVPVYYYNTQITIHGIFPEIKNNYLTGYKSIFQNKNQSIGVKYIAVDYYKKKRIYELSSLYGWYIYMSSSEYFIYKISNNFYDKDKFVDELKEMRTKISTIDKSLFIGSIGCRIVRNIYGSYNIIATIEIGIVREKNIIKLIENICRTDIVTVENKMKENLAQKEQERIKFNKEYQEKLNKEKEEQERLSTLLIPAMQEHGWIKSENVKLYNDLIVIKNDRYDGMVMIKFTKEKQQKKYRITKKKIKNIDDLDNFVFKTSYYYNERLYNKTYIKNCWIKKELVEQTREEIDKSTQPKLEINTTQEKPDLGISIIDYSDKAIAIIGNTKEIKDKLKKMGGRFNPRLSCGCGWIFPKSKMNEVSSMLSKQRRLL